MATLKPETELTVAALTAGTVYSHLSGQRARTR